MKKEHNNGKDIVITSIIFMGVIAFVNTIGIYWGREGHIKLGSFLFMAVLSLIALLGMYYNVFSNTY